MWNGTLPSGAGERCDRSSHVDARSQCLPRDLQRIERVEVPDAGNLTRAVKPGPHTPAGKGWTTLTR